MNMELPELDYIDMPVILDHIGLTRTASVVCALIIQLCRNEPAAIPIKYIAKYAGCHPKTVRSAVRSLEAADLVVVQRRREQGLSSIYSITDNCRELCGLPSQSYEKKRRTRKPLTQAAIDELNCYLNLSPLSSKAK